jgi:hypothetical protein
MTAISDTSDDQVCLIMIIVTHTPQCYNPPVYGSSNVVTLQPTKEWLQEIRVNRFKKQILGRFLWPSCTLDALLVHDSWHKLCIINYENRHLERMEENRMPKMIFSQELEGTRRRERLRNRWNEEAETYRQVLGVRRWTELATDREKWQDIVRQSKAHSEL